jgi:hypothetical protein
MPVPLTGVKPKQNAALEPRMANPRLRPDERRRAVSKMSVPTKEKARS